jgi:ATP synthase subunit 6
MSSVSNPLEQFEIVPLFGSSMNLFGMYIPFNNSALMTLIATCASLVMLALVLFEGRGSLVPNRWQTFFESIYEFISTTVVDNIGTKGYGFFPFVFVLFLFVLQANLIGMVPYGFTSTSHIVVTLFFTMTIYIGCVILLFYNHGYHGMSLFLPKGAPLPLVPLLVLIELLSHVMRIVSLSVRLFANMMAGHILLKVLLGFAWTMMMAGGFLFVLHLLPLAVVYILLFLETAVAIIQAYVFVALTCIYLNEALNLH